MEILSWQRKSFIIEGLTRLSRACGHSRISSNPNQNSVRPPLLEEQHDANDDKYLKQKATISAACRARTRARRRTGEEDALKVKRRKRINCMERERGQRPESEIQIAVNANQKHWETWFVQKLFKWAWAAVLAWKDAEESANYVLPVGQRCWFFSFHSSTSFLLFKQHQRPHAGCFHF